MRTFPAFAAVLAVAGCVSGHGSPPTATALPPAPTAVPVTPGEAVSCEMLARSILAEGSTRHAGLALRAAAEGPVDNDLGLPLADRGNAAPCELVVGRPDALPAAAPRVVGRERVEARHAAGLVERPNPEHAKLERALEKAERGRKGSGVDVMRTGEPTADLIGAALGLVIAGAEHLAGRAEAAELRRRLAATPATVSVPKERAYAYEAVTVEAARAARVRLALLDRRSGRAREALSHVDETRRLRIERGRRPDDAAGPLPTGALGGMADVTAWQEGAPPLRLSALVRHVLEVGSPVADAGDILDRWAAVGDVAPAAGPTAAAAAADAIVPDQVRQALFTVRGAVGSGTGVGIGPGRLVVAATPLGRSDLAEIVDARGHDGRALVRRRAGGVALLETSLDGPFIGLAKASPGPALLLDLAGDRPALSSGRLLARDGDCLLWLADGDGGPADGIVLVDGLVAGFVDDGGAVLDGGGLRQLLEP